MKLEINLDNEILDYINEDELKRDVKYNVETQIKEQIKATIEDAGLNIPLPQRVITVLQQNQ